MKTSNLLRELPTDLTEEITETLIRSSSIRIERIVSQGHHSPEGFWYDQEESEWVLLLAGSAVLEFENRADNIKLAAGDCLNIPAHERHRVESTDPNGPTIWLAVFYSN